MTWMDTGTQHTCTGEIVNVDFYLLEPRWLKPNKTKKRKISPNPVTKSRNKKNGNYSIKPPDNSRPKGQEGELKFNYKTLRFERLSPSQNLDRRKSIGATEGIGSVQRYTQLQFIEYISYLLLKTHLKCLIVFQ